jgi:hypothetical protein
MDGFGLRHVSGTGSNITTLDVGISESDDYRDIFGPLTDASVVLPIRDTGVDRVAPGLLDQEFHDRAPLRRIEENSSMNSAGLLAAPRGENGVAIFRVVAGQPPQLLTTFGKDIAESNATCWITDDVLAVADGINNVRFYRVAADASWQSLIGTYRPAAEPLYIRALASRNNRLAIGLQDGQVFIVDATPTTLTAAQDWQLYN